MLPFAPQPMMTGQNQMGNMMSSIPQDVIKKVLKSVSDTVGMQASEAIQQGVPWGHVVDELIKMSPVSSGVRQGMAISGGNQQPPQMGMNDPNSGQKPPQGPNPTPKSQDNTTVPVSSDNLGPMLAQNVQPQKPGVQTTSNPLSRIPTAQELSGRFIQPQQGKGFNRIGPNGEFISGGLFGGMFGLKPSDYAQIQSGNAMNPANQVQESVVKAAITPVSADTIYKEAIQSEREGMLKPNDIFTKFEQASQPFILQRDAYDRIVASAKDPSAAGDLALIYNYMKLLDPGSTVREGEFATAQNSGSIPSRIWAQYNKVMNGQRLNRDQRADFVGKSGSLFKSAELQQKKTTEQFSALAKRNGISDPSRVIRDTGLSQKSKKYVRTGVYNGQKVGMTADGKVEVIGV